MLHQYSRLSLFRTAVSTSAMHYCSSKKAKRITKWIGDLDSHYSRELAPSEPPPSERDLSQVGSSHRAVSERLALKGPLAPTAQSSNASSRTASSKRAISESYSSKKPSVNEKNSGRHESRNSDSNKTSSHGHPGQNALSNQNPLSKASSKQPQSQKTPSQPAPSHLSSPRRRSSDINQKIYPSGLDPYTVALNEKLFHEHRQIEDRARKFVKVRPGESGEQYNTRMNGRVHQLDDRLVDLDMKWRMLEMEQEAGLRKQ